MSKTMKDDGSIEEMMQHLDKAKQRKERRAKLKERQSHLTGIAREMAERADTAVLSSNHTSRLKELASLDAVTHRSGKEWVSARAAMETRGKLPIYYRQDGMITHTGVITRLVLNPDPESEEVKELRKHITDDDTYSDYFDELDTTTYVVKQGRRLEEPFSQTELIKVSDGEPIDEGYSWQPSYVFQRTGDFPDF